MIYGQGSYRYELAENWGEIPAEWQVGPVAGINTDRDDNVYVLTRTDPPVIVMDRDGKIIDHWGGDFFDRPHGVYLTEDGRIYCADDTAHCVYGFDAAHRLFLTLGTRGVPSDTGCVNKKWQTILRGAGPFNYPTNVALSKDGDIYVSDGYGNARVHCFDPEGRLKFSWGEPGTEPGHFNLPHSLRFDAEGILYVCDRQNHRVQLFEKDGRFLDQWTDLIRPADICFAPDGTAFVAECKRCSDFAYGVSRVSVLDRSGHVLARIGGECDYDEHSESHHTAHGIAIDSEGCLYVGEVGKNFPASYTGLQKLCPVK